MPFQWSTRTLAPGATADAAAEPTLTPEQIAAIRAERAAKREALEARERGSGGS